MILLFLLFSQYQFGQNKIQYNQHEWLMHETKHFEIYYYKSGEVLIPFAEDVLEEAYRRLKDRFNYREGKEEVKIPVIIYKSHPDFEETNVILERIPESVGGFSEIFKKRIVLPFKGSYSEFRHILYHELVHIFQYRILYGKGINALRRLATLRIPLWFIEGMAEYESMGWDESVETYMRDAVLNNRIYSIPQLEYLGGYTVYKEGQSILHFISERYGEKKIGELLNKVKVTNTLSSAIKSVLGVNTEKLNEEWMESLKKKYWPIVGEKDDIDDIARPLVKHKQFKNIYNYAPSISPGGDKIIYYTDREGEVQVRLVSAINGEDLGLFIKGGRSPKYESLHLMEGHIDFSPDGKNIAFSAMEAGKDVLYIFDVRTRSVKSRINLDMDRIRWPEWSSDGFRIVFMGLKNGASDIYVYDLRDSSLINITHDRYSDGEPSWKGDSIVFVSDRPKTGEWDYSNERLYITDFDGNIRLYLDFGEEIISPMAYNSDIYFISYRNGGRNLYVFKEDSGEVRQITDLIGSVESFSISPSGKFAISVYSNIGWDIYIIDSIDDLKMRKPGEPVAFRHEYIEVDIEDEESRSERAPLNFGIDYVATTLGYYSDYGIFGYLYMGLSDMLGNHRVYALFNNTDLTQSDFYVQYLYLKHRVDYSAFLMKQSDYFLYGNDVIRGDIWNLGAEIWYPINRFNRFELGISGYKLGEETWEWNYDEDVWEKVRNESSYGTFGSISFIRDNTIWGYISPVKGFRGRITFNKNLINRENFWNFDDMRLDLRKYWYISNDWSFAVRLFLLHSWGEDKEKFSTIYLGGGRSIRGYDYNYIAGTTAGFVNLELRLPLVKILELGFPPLRIGGINGALFADIGGATYNYKEFRFFNTENSWPTLEDPFMSFGLEFRLNLGITMFNFDISKRTDLNKISEDTYYDFYLGFPF